MIGNVIEGMFKTPDPIVKQRTELGRYAICPHQANLCEEHSEEIETHDALPETGQLVHAVAKAAIDSCEYGLQDAADYIKEELPKIRPDLQPQALAAGRNLANEIHKFSGNQVLLNQEAVTRALAPATNITGEILIVTEPDLVLATTKASSILSLDYKTGFKYRSKQEAFDDFQTCVGSWVLFGKFPNVQKIHWFYLNTRFFTRSYCLIEREKDEDNLQARIFETYRIAESDCDDAWPEPSKCSICPVVKWCKLCNNDVKELDGNTKLYIDTYTALEARLDEMGKIIKEATKDGRRLYGSNGYFDDTPKRISRRVSFKTETEDEEKDEA